jgi:hypothetical protein
MSELDEIRARDACAGPLSITMAEVANQASADRRWLLAEVDRLRHELRIALAEGTAMRRRLQKIDPLCQPKDTPPLEDTAEVDRLRDTVNKFMAVALEVPIGQYDIPMPSVASMLATDASQWVKSPDA